jgi:dehydrogenase/reductase SDR family protein 12
MRLVQWLAQKGDELLDNALLINVTKPGYLLRQPWWDPDDTWVSMHGKVCIVTGANSGLGKATSTRLAALGARVYMLCRNEERGRQARLEIIHKTKNMDVHLELVDMSDQASIRAFVERFGHRESQLDVLVNNAGAFLPRREVSPQGVECTFATNILGPFLLTNLLVSRLTTAAPARVINVSSASLYFAKLNVADPLFERRPYVGPIAYAESKRAILVLTELWAEQLVGTGIGVHAMHPGWTDTPAVRRGLGNLGAPVRFALRTPEQGVDTILWLAVNPNIDASDSGQLWFDRRPRAKHKLGLGRSASKEDARQLWRICCRLADYTTMPVPVEGVPMPGKP